MLTAVEIFNHRLSPESKLRDSNCIFYTKIVAGLVDGVAIILLFGFATLDLTGASQQISHLGVVGAIIFFGVGGGVLVCDIYTYLKTASRLFQNNADASGPPGPQLFDIVIEENKFAFVEKKEKNLSEKEALNLLENAERIMEENIPPKDAKEGDEKLQEVVDAVVKHCKPSYFGAKRNTKIKAKYNKFKNLTIVHLPFEILEQIFNNLRLGDFANMMLVSRDVNTIAGICRARLYGYPAFDPSEAQEYYKNELKPDLLLAVDHLVKQSQVFNSIQPILKEYVVFTTKKSGNIDLIGTLKNIVHATKDAAFLYWLFNFENIEPKRGHLFLIQTLLDYGARPSADSLFAHISNPEILKLLCKYGANANHKSLVENTPLHKAASAGNLESMQILIDYHADVNAKNGNNETPLVCCKWDKEVIALLLQHNAKPNEADNYGTTPILRIDSSPDSAEIVKLLCKYGANIDHQNQYNNSALHIAVACANIEAIRALIELGAKKNLINFNQKTPFEVIPEAASDEIKKQIIDLFVPKEALLAPEPEDD
jgi:hypothetical protein